MMDCIIYLSPPNVKQTFNLHHVDYLILTNSILPSYIHLIRLVIPILIYIKQRLSPAKESSDHDQLLAYSFRLPNTFHGKTIQPYASNSHG
jgi:hypothetical protein